MDAPVMLAADDVLAQPTRARLFALLAELRRPAGTVELAGRLGLHPNGFRIHLERMERAGLAERSRVRGQRGRPRDARMIAPDAHPGGSAPRGYQELGRWLTRALPAHRGELRGIKETGREIGRELAAQDGGRVEDAFKASLVALGFQHSVEDRGGGRVRFCLRNCPYADAVHENQLAICALHEGMTRGVLDVLEPQSALADFVPHDPHDAGCVIELTGVSATAD